MSNAKATYESKIRADKAKAKRREQLTARAYDGALSFASSRDSLMREVMRDCVASNGRRAPLSD